MSEEADAGGQDQSIEELLHAAHDATSPRWVEEYRNALAAFGEPAVTGVAPWLAEEVRGARAITVIEQAGRFHGARAGAIQALRFALSSGAASRSIWHLIDGALERLGEKAAPRPRGPAGRPRDGERLPSEIRVAPAWKTIHHIVEGHAESTPTRWGDVYLFYCGRFFSGDWVRSKGGLQEPAGQEICGICLARMTGGSR